MTKTKQEENFRIKLKKYFKEYAETTGIHGLRYLVEERSIIEKSFWAIILLISLLGCLFMISLIIEKYQNNPVEVSFGTKDIAIYEVPFPAVTICPESKCAEKKFNYSEIYKKSDGLRTLNDTEKRYFCYTTMLCNDIYTGIYGSSEFEDANEFAYEDFYNIMEEVNPDNELTSCRFMGNNINSCFDIFTPIITDSGMCYSFNILDRKDIFRENVVHYKNFHTVTAKLPEYNIDTGYCNKEIDTYPSRALMSGTINSLLISMQHTQYDSDLLCNSFHEGYRILVHNPSEIPRVSNFYFGVPLDKSIVAAVTPKLVTTTESVKRFKPSKRNCYLADERPLKFFKKYTQSNCLFECLTNATLNECDCVNYHMPRTKGTKICGIAKTECMRKVEWKLKRNELESLMSRDVRSDCDCKPSCTSLTYDVELSSSHYYFREYMNLINATQVLDLGNDHYSMLSIYMKVDNFISVQRDELYGVTDLISNFGGLLGLFTGFSLISLAEIIYFCTMRVVYNLKLYGRWFGNE